LAIDVDGKRDAEEADERYAQRLLAHLGYSTVLLQY
jgi:hypothetical protein